VSALLGSSQVFVPGLQIVLFAGFRWWIFHFLMGHIMHFIVLLENIVLFMLCHHDDALVLVAEPYLVKINIPQMGTQVHYPLDHTATIIAEKLRYLQMSVLCGSR
jgi:hypothetical protein